MRIYIRETPTKEEVTEMANRFKTFDCIMGDVNLNPAIDDQKAKLETICGRDKILALKEITTDNNNQLDHIILGKSWSEFCFSTA